MRPHVSPFVARWLRGLGRNQRLIASGRKFVLDGIVCVPGFPDAEVRIFDNWSADPFSNRSWQWSVASFRFIQGLIAYHAAEGDHGAIDLASEALASWDTAVAGPLADYEFAWHDHATANQAENLSLLLAYLSGSEAYAQHIDPLVEGLVRRADLLATDEFYSRFTNHGIEQARILALVAQVLPGHERAATWHALAMARLGEELEHAFTSEGVHVENSPGYHAYVCLSFLKVRDFIEPGPSDGLAARIDSLMPRAMRYLAHILRPDGRLPCIGDTSLEPLSDHFRRYSKTRDYQRLTFAMTGGASGMQPEDTTALYPESGYFVCRDSWRSQDSAEPTFHLVFRCGFRSTYHRHDDDLSIVLFDGEDWLIDSGAFNYVESDPVRAYLRSKWAHNVPVMVDQQGKRWARTTPSMALPMRRSWRRGAMHCIRATSHCYPGFVASRELTVDPTLREFSVVDDIVPVDDPSPRRFSSLWHLPADKSVQVRGQQVIITSTTTGRRLLVDNVGGPAASIGLIDPGIEGRDGPVRSVKPNALEPALLLSFTFEGAAAMHSALRFRLLEPA